MDEDDFYADLCPIPYDADVEPLLDGSTLQIGHFKVPEDSRGQSIGADTMSYILDVANQHDITKVDVNIAYTLAPEDAPRETDPTTKFLRHLGFTITLHENTVTGLKRL